MPTVDMLCLANSRKYSERCVAGLRLDGGGWVRPIGPNEHGTLHAGHYRLHNGAYAQVLDVLRLELGEPRPEPHQPENWLVGHGSWRLLERPAGARHCDLVRPHIVAGPNLFGNRGDRVPLATLSNAPVDASLALVKPASFRWQVTTARSGRSQLRASFALDSALYNLAVTDPIWEARLRSRVAGTYSPEATEIQADEELLLTISLGEPFLDGCCYKLIAAVIVLPHSWNGLI